jgi:DNA-binding beta-propeller fold protein YncE
MLLSKDGQYMYISAYSSGYVLKIGLSDLIQTARSAKGQRIEMPEEQKGQEVFVGYGPRTIRSSPDGKYLFAAIYDSGEIVTIETESMTVASHTLTDPYPVGMDVSADGSHLCVTAQSRHGSAGKSVIIYNLTYRNPPEVASLSLK